MSEQKPPFEDFDESKSSNTSSQPGFDGFGNSAWASSEQDFGKTGSFGGGFNPVGKTENPNETQSFEAPRFDGGGFQNSGFQHPGTGAPGLSSTGLNDSGFGGVPAGGPPGFAPSNPSNFDSPSFANPGFSAPPTPPPPPQTPSTSVPANTSISSAGFGPQQQGSGTSNIHGAGSSASISGVLHATSAPIAVLMPSLVLGVISIVLSGILTFGSYTATETTFRVLSVVAWLAAGIFGITLLGLYFNADNRRRAEGLYSILGWKTAMYWATVIVLLLGIVWSAVEIGQWVGKL